MENGDRQYNWEKSWVGFDSFKKEEKLLDEKKLNFDYVWKKEDTFPEDLQRECIWS